MRCNIESPLAQTAAGATAQAVLSACVHCGMCNATCPTFHLTGDEADGPRGRIYLIKQALEGDPISRLTQTHLDRCLSCRACETTCPSGVEYHRLLDVGRVVVAKKVRRAWPDRLYRWAIRTVVTSAALVAPLVAAGRLIGKIPAKTPARTSSTGTHARRMTLLKGCVQSAAATHFNAATTRVFDAVGVELHETPGVGCCGALHAHLDAPDAARRLARTNIDAWIADFDAGAEAVVVNASGCAAFIRDYPDVLANDPIYAAKARRVVEHLRDPIEILREIPPKSARAPRDPRIAVHDSCTLRNGPGHGGAVAKLLAGLGYDPQPVADPHMCCGSAGAYSLLQPDFAKRLRAEKLAALTAGTPTAIYTANIGCWLHLSETSPVPVRHWIEAVDEVVG